MTSPSPRLDCFKTFATYISTDDELLVFRRFNKANARALLYLQSELLSIEEELAEFDRTDAESGNKELMASAKCWERLAARAIDHDEEQQRMKTINRMQEVLLKYSELP